MVKLLGVNVDSELSLDFHIKDLCRRAEGQLSALLRLKKRLDQDAQLAIVRSFVSSNFKYCPPIWHFCSKKSTQKLSTQKMSFKRALRSTFDDTFSDYSVLLEKASMCSLELGRLICKFLL